MSQFAISLDDVQQAATRIAQYVVRTPLIESEPLAVAADCRLYFKAENLQHIGAFKARGAMNAVLSLEPSAASAGVVTHSSGNHAAALARAAKLRGLRAHVVMPENSAAIKIAAVRSFAVEPIFCEPTSDSRTATANAVQADTGATLVHPYNDPAVMAGQGTVGLEILEHWHELVQRQQAVGRIDIVLVPVGGGGLLSGVLTAIKSLQPSIQVIAVEPELADDAARSLSSGRIEQPTRYDTIADGLRTPLGSHTFPIIQSFVDDVVLVPEEMILEATRKLPERGRLVAEPSGAVTYAAILTDPTRFAGKNVVAVISGGNLDFGACRLGRTAAE